AQGRPEPPETPRFASWDEVNVLAHGLLQLGNGLREHVERTRGQLGELERRLGACGAACKDPEGSAAPPFAPENLVPPAGDAVPETLRSFQTQLKAQNSRIQQLFQKVAQQQRHLEKQHLRIQNLQNQVPDACPRWGGRLKLDLWVWTWFGVWEPDGGVRVSCEKNPPGDLAPFWADGGWTVIQRRQDGSVDFNQPWEAYKDGFGDPQGEFWLGLEKVHRIMGDRGSRLAVQLQDWEGNAESLQFPVHLGGEDTAYSLQLTAPVASKLGPRTHGPDQVPFSLTPAGGWWFGTCGHSNLNGQYFHSIPRQRQQLKKGIFWKTWRGRYYPLQATTMLIQPTAAEAAS
ncbi:hypothetical protein E2I00_013647, partial [Balaenoptera physalus]